MPAWYQQSLTPPEVYEITVKVGLIPSTDHAQVWWEVADPTTRVLIGSGSHHHCTIAQALPVLEVQLEKLVRLVDGLVEPF